MRLLKILALTMIVALVVAGVASAKVRDGMTTVAETAEDVLERGDRPVTVGDAVGEPVRFAVGRPVGRAVSRALRGALAEPLAEPEEDYANHGAAVSAVARDKEAVGTWTNPAGKVITNHGKAVSAVAKSDAGKKGTDDGDGEAGGEAGKNGKDK